MSWFSFVAIYFVLWWLILFAVLPFGLRTQEEASDVTLGTVRSAPSRPHFGKAALRTTIITTIVCSAYFYVTYGLGYGFNDIPSIVPDFSAKRP